MNKRQPIRFIRRVCRNLKLWWPIISTDEQWDNGYLEEVIYHKLKLMQAFFESDKTHISDDDTDIILTQIRRATEALERLIEDDYVQYPDGKWPTHKTVPSPRGPGLYTQETTYHPEFTKEDLIAEHEAAAQRELDDRALVYNTLRDCSHWWWD